MFIAWYRFGLNRDRRNEFSAHCRRHLSQLSGKEFVKVLPDSMVKNIQIQLKLNWEVKTNATDTLS